MNNLTRTTGLWLGIGAAVLMLISVSLGYTLGKQAELPASSTKESIWEVDSAVVARRSITVKGEVSEILEKSILIESQNEKTNQKDQLAIPADNNTQIYLTLRREGKSEAPSLITLSQVEVGDRVDAVIDIDDLGGQKTTSLAIWRDL